jgi:Phosphorylated CTD interacting factor 1 WW domain/Glycosyl transferase family 8
MACDREDGRAEFEAERGSHIKTMSEHKCAWVVLVMRGAAYLPGALVVARSLKTKHAKVAMVTDDVPEAARAMLRLVYDRVVEVPYVVQASRRMHGKKQAETYAAWADAAHTKWNALTLTDYAKVILVDADMMFLEDCDELFALRAPAACYSLPWAQPWMPRGGALNPYIAPGAVDFPHGATVPAATVMAALHQETFVGGGFLVLLKPSAERFEKLIAMLRKKAIYGEDYRTHSGPDEASIAEVYARDGIDWTHIHQRYAAIPWKTDWVATEDARARHYHGRKPWDASPDEFPDLADWWRLTVVLAAEHPELRPVFRIGGADDSVYRTGTTPALDAELATFRLTNDLRALVVSHAKKNGSYHLKKDKVWQEIGSILERWIMAMVNTRAVGDPPVYRSTTLDDAFNNKLAGELADKRWHIARTADEAAELVEKMLALVDRRIAMPAQSSALVETPTEMSYGAFRVEVTPRLAMLRKMAGDTATMRVALRYAAVLAGGQQWALPQAHVDQLYECGVRGEGFASPLNSRLLGKEGVRLCSVFPDTDAAFGFGGSFFEADLAGVDWIVNPPFIEDILLRTAQRVIAALVVSPSTFYVVFPLWEDSAGLRLLRASPVARREQVLQPKEYFYEDSAGNRIYTRAASIYLALSSAKTPDVRKMEAAMRHLTTIR